MVEDVVEKLCPYCDLTTVGDEQRLDLFHRRVFSQHLSTFENFYLAKMHTKGELPKSMGTIAYTPPQVSRRR